MSRPRISASARSAAVKQIGSLYLLIAIAIAAAAVIFFVSGAASASTGKPGPPPPQRTGPNPPPATTPNPPPATTPNPPPPTGTNPPATVTGVLITRRSGTLRRGSHVSARALFGHRTFLNASNGYALASTGGADYPVRTTNGGRTWHTDGPAVHLDAAQAPLAVSDAGAANRRTLFACCGAQVVDATGDSGKHWWRAFLGDVVLAVTTRPGGELIAIAQTATNSTGSQAATWVYTSKDGGHHWHLNSKEGAF